MKRIIPKERVLGKYIWLGLYSLRDLHGTVLFCSFLDIPHCVPRDTILGASESASLLIVI